MTPFDPMTQLDPETNLDFALDYTATAAQLAERDQVTGTDALAEQILAGLTTPMAAQEALDVLEEAETLHSLHKSSLMLPAPQDHPQATVNLELTVALLPAVGAGTILQAVLQTEEGRHNSRIALAADHPLALAAAATLHGPQIAWRDRPRG